METHENQTVRAVLAGDRAAAESLVDDHYATVYGFLRRFTGQDADAADLTQRTFARAWQALPSFAGRSSFRSWMHTIAWRTYVDWLRANHRPEARSDTWWASQTAPTPSPADTVGEADLAAAVYAAVDRLDADLRVTVHLHYYQGLSIAETAEALAIGTATVKDRIRRALRHLQSQLRTDRRWLQGTPVIRDSRL